MGHTHTLLFLLCVFIMVTTSVGTRSDHLALWIIQFWSGLDHVWNKLNSLTTWMHSPVSLCPTFACIDYYLSVYIQQCSFISDLVSGYYEVCKILILKRSFITVLHEVCNQFSHCQTISVTKGSQRANWHFSLLAKTNVTQRKTLKECITHTAVYA